MKTLFPPDVPSLSPAVLASSVPSAAPQTKDLWSRIRDGLHDSLDEDAYETWIKPLKARPDGPTRLTILLPNLVFYQGIHNEYMARIEQTKCELGYDDLVIQFEIDGGASVTGDQGGLQDEGVAEQLVKSGADSATSRRIGIGTSHESRADSEREGMMEGSPNAFSRSLSGECHLNPNYTFDTFVRGDSNQFAVATCLAAAENPGRAYNPLFIYGSTGLGKTHLLHAVGNLVQRNNPQAVVTYIFSERFMNEMIYCLRFSKMWDFRQKYRNCDVFLVDDIQFISGNKQATQEEFFHTFNTLYAAKKQIVITSDLIPKDIPDIEDRLRNRFQWGLIADIQPPSVEHRIAILYSKAEKLGLRLRDDVAEYIAKAHKTSVRELEGALHRIQAFAALQGEPITLSLAQRTFRDVIHEPPKLLTIETVQRVVADHYKLKISDLKSKRRQRNLALPRQIAMYLSRKLTGASFPDIGDKFGGKDHTTALHNVRKIEDSLDKDLELKSNVEALSRQLEQLQ